MKTLTRLLFTAIALVALAFSTGCQIRPQDAATKLNIKVSPIGKEVSIELPKNTQAQGLDVGYDPSTKAIHFKANTLNADASSVLESAGAAQAQANAALTASLSNLVNVLVAAQRQQLQPVPQSPAPQPITP